MVSINNSLENNSAQEELSSKIILIEERMKVDIHHIETGKVSVYKKVISEEVTQQVPLTNEQVEVKHVPFNMYVDTAPAIRYEADTTIISVVKEVLVIEKKLMLIEEIHLIKTAVTVDTPVTETLRREEAEVNRTGSTEMNT